MNNINVYETTKSYESLKRFDEQFIKLNSYDSLGYKMLKYIFTFIIVFCICIFFPMSTGNVIPLYSWSYVCLYYALTSHINPYLYIKRNNIYVPVFKLLRDTPINRKAFIQLRFCSLFNYTLKLACICFAIRFICILLFEKNVSFTNIAMSLGHIILFFGVGLGLATWTIYGAARE